MTSDPGAGPGRLENGPSVAYGVLRDASGYRTHRQVDSRDWKGHIPLYHVPVDERMSETACGRPAAEFTATRVETIPTRRRCQRPGCKQRWPDA
jgi:hypothetical protein